MPLPLGMLFPVIFVMLGVFELAIFFIGLFACIRADKRAKSKTATRSLSYIAAVLSTLLLMMQFNLTQMFVYALWAPLYVLWLIPGEIIRRLSEPI